MHHLESSTYEVFEKDPVKYAKYYEASLKAFMAKKEPELVVAVVGAGRGPLVAEALKAAKKANKKVSITQKV